MREPREIEFLFEPQEEGGFYVTRPNLPGLHTEGETLDDAEVDVRGAESLRRRATGVRGTSRDSRCAPENAHSSVTDRLPTVPALISSPLSNVWETGPAPTRKPRTTPQLGETCSRARLHLAIGKGEAGPRSAGHAAPRARGTSFRNPNTYRSTGGAQTTAAPFSGRAQP